MWHPKKLAKKSLVSSRKSGLFVNVINPGTRNQDNSADLVVYLERHTKTVRMILAVGFCLAFFAFVQCALGQTNLDTDILQTEKPHNLSPMAGVLRIFLWSLAAALLVIAAALCALRYRVVTNLYKATSDSQWKEDSEADAGERIDVDEVLGACEAIEKPEEEPEPERQPQARMFTPAHGPAWSESMLKAFLGTCLKVNCLGRTWRESATWRPQPANMPDPREAELVRRLMQRWQEFDVDQESGVFFERSSSAGKNRVCVISVSKDKRTLVEASFNAGFVIENVGRYLRNTDLVCQRGLGEYHAPTKDELASMTPGEKESLIRIVEIPNPWEAMIA